jgi:transcription elongation factor Elf1
MGRRRARQKKIVTKRVVKLGTVFKCLQCNHEDAVDCKMDKSAKVGRLQCRICAVTYQMKINYLMEPIDVYCSWIDSTKAMNDADTEDNRRQSGGNSSGRSSSSSSGGNVQNLYDDEEESDEEEAVNPAELARKKLAEEEAKEKQVDQEADELFGSSESDSDDE